MAGHFTFAKDLLGSVLVALQSSIHQEARSDAHRREDDLIVGYFSNHDPNSGSRNELVQEIVPKVTQEARGQAKGDTHVKGTSQIEPESQ